MTEVSRPPEYARTIFFGDDINTPKEDGKRASGLGLRASGFGLSAWLTALGFAFGSRLPGSVPRGATRNDCVLARSRKSEARSRKTWKCTPPARSAASVLRQAARCR